jgi:hypothetical protein
VIEESKRLSHADCKSLVLHGIELFSLAIAIANAIGVSNNTTRNKFTALEFIVPRDRGASPNGGVSGTARAVMNRYDVAAFDN